MRDETKQHDERELREDDVLLWCGGYVAGTARGRSRCAKAAAGRHALSR
jgi:hypothetical protein